MALFETICWFPLEIHVVLIRVVINIIAVAQIRICSAIAEL